MKDRIVKLMDHYRISPAQLADNMGVQRSSISHILSGRNKPSFDFLIKLLENYSEINAEWMVLGKGNMIKTSGYDSVIKENSEENNLFTKKEYQNVENKDFTTNNKNLKYETSKTIQPDRKEPFQEFTNVNNVKQIVIIYENDTFRIINKQ